jgi:hypothetical protein
MEDSILTSTKKTLGLDADYTAFDLDIITHINLAFSVLNQLGVGPVEGFMIEDKSSTWDEFVVPLSQMSMIRTYVYLKVSVLFDPPTTSYLIEAKTNQIDQYEWRLNVFREFNDFPNPIPEEEVEV